MHPQFRVGGVTGAVVLDGPNSRALECEIVDVAGRTTDTCSIMLDDRNAELAIPPVGVTISVAMGYLESGLYPMGLFIVDEVTVSGWPRSMIIKAHGADLTKEFKQARTQDYQHKNGEQIVGEIAARNGWESMVLGPFAAFTFGYIAQTEESDANFLTRLGLKFDSVAKVTNGKLVFVKQGMGMSASGLSLGTAIARYPDNVIEYEAKLKQRPAHKDTVGAWWDKAPGERVEEKKNPLLTGSLAAGGGGPLSVRPPGTATFKLPQVFPDGQKEAEATSQARADKLARDEGELNITIIGNPGIVSQTPLQVVNVRPDIDGMWSIKTVVHTINSCGFKTMIQAELPGGAAGGGGGGDGGANPLLGGNL